MDKMSTYIFFILLQKKIKHFFHWAILSFIIFNPIYFLLECLHSQWPNM